MGAVTFSPLASGMLTGKYDNGIPEDSRFARKERQRGFLYSEENAQNVRDMKAIADDAGINRAQLALAWTKHHRAVNSVITGATSVAQLETNLGAVEVTLSEDALSRMDEIFHPDTTLF